MQRIGFGKERFRLTFVHKLAVIVLVVLGLLLLCDPFIYRKELKENLSDIRFSFLQAGDYSLELGYQGSPGNNTVIVWSDLLTDSDNQMGVELARQDIDEGAGIIAVPLHLDQGTHDVRVRTALDGQPGYYFFSAAIQRVQLLGRDRFFLSALCLFTALCIFMLGRFVPKEKYMEPTILIMLGLIVSLPLFSGTLIGADDVYYHLTRIEGLYKGLMAGEFPVRINSIQNGSFGNLSATMYPQLFLYFAAFLRIAGVSLILSYKVLVVAANIGTAFFSYYSVKNMCKSPKMGLVAAVLYTFSIYRITNLYFRAALGEMLAMVFLPLVLWGLYEILWGERRRWYLLLFGVTGVLQSHVLSLEMSLIFMIVEAILWIFSRKQDVREKFLRAACGLKAVVGVCLLNMSFLLPFLFFSGEDLQVYHMESELADSVVYLSQLFALFPGVSGKNLVVGTTTGEMPLTLGAVLALGAVLFCIAAMGKKETSPAVELGKHCLCYGIAAVVLASWLFPWNAFNRNPVFLQLTTPFQFAWRFLGPASLFLSVTSAVGIVLFVSRDRGCNWLYGAVAAVLLCSTFYYFDTTVYEKYSTSDEMTLEGLTYSDSMYMYSDGDSFKAFHLNYRLQDSYVKTLNGTRLSYSNYRKTATQVSVDIQQTGSARGEEYLLFPLYYFPGYEVLVNGEKVQAVEKDTLVACRLPKGSAHVQVRYRGLWFFWLGDVITLVTVLGWGGTLIVKRTKARKRSVLNGEQ